MKKSERIETFIDSLPVPPPGCNGLPRGYLGFFDCFNRQLYYEAHDVLEHLWLADRSGPDAAFYKGLIQIAGAFVHLKKQRERPDHPTDGRRLRPAARLFRLAVASLEGYPARHRSLDLEEVRRFCERHSQAIEGAHYRVNPWQPGCAPQLSPGCA